MGEINIPRDQQIAIAAIDASELDRLIEQAIQEERLGDLRRPLTNAAPTSKQNSDISKKQWRGTARPRHHQSGRKQKTRFDAQPVICPTPSAL